MRETLNTVSFKNKCLPGNDICYQLEKERTDKDIAVIIYDITDGKRKELDRVRYKNVGEEYASPFLSWENLFLCSATYNISPVYDYMNRAVQEGKKTAATVYIEPNSSEGKDYIKSLPEDCGAMPYSEGALYVYHKGRLSDFFDFDRIRSLYEKHGIYGIRWGEVKSDFEKDLSFFCRGKKGFVLHGPGGKEQTIITGLLLGYPIESTIAYISADKR